MFEEEHLFESHLYLEHPECVVGCNLHITEFKFSCKQYIKCSNNFNTFSFVNSKEPNCNKKIELIPTKNLNNSGQCIKRAGGADDLMLSEWAWGGITSVAEK